MIKNETFICPFILFFSHFRKDTRNPNLNLDSLHKSFITLHSDMENLNIYFIAKLEGMNEEIK